MEPVQFTEKFHQYSNWRDQLVAVIGMYHDWRRQYDLNDANSSNIILSILESLTQDRLSLAFVAEFSRGKTELINALFFAETGVRLLPSSPGRTTMCPTEIFYDKEGGDYIRLLDISTRLEDKSIADLKQDASRWVQFKLDRNDPAQMQAAFKELALSMEVPKNRALELGLFDENDDAEQSSENKTTVQIPRWRHAQVSFRHPLLEAGLVILDTPGLNALGSEPELTLNMLPSAQAIIFVLAADTGVTKSDLTLWNNHILRANNPSRQGLAVVLNKIDAMWDDMVGEQGFERLIESQINSSGRILDVPDQSIFPVSAKQALFARLKHDDDLLERSRLQALENYFSQVILKQRQKILLDIVLRDIGFMMRESYTLTEINFESEYKQLKEFEKLTFENQGLISDLTETAQQQQETYFKNIEHFKVSRLEFQKKLENLLEALSPMAFDALVKESMSHIDSSMTTIGMKENMRRLFDELNRQLQYAVKISKEAETYVVKLHKEFDTSYGFKEIKPETFQIRGYQMALEDVLRRGEDYRASTKTTLTEKSIVILKLYKTIILQARAVMFKAHRDASIWGDNVMSPLKHQIFDYKKQIENRLIVLRSASNSKNELDQNISRLQGQLQKLEMQRRELRTIVRALEHAAQAGQPNKTQKKHEARSR